MDEFRFENTVTLKESDFLLVWGVVRPTRFAGKVRFVILVAAGILCLFTAYTLLLGLFLLGFAVLVLLLPGILPLGARQKFRQLKYLRDPLTYGVSDQRLWVKSATIDASVQWSMLYSWSETEGWLVLSPYAIPALFLSLARLKEEGLYGRVRALAASHAREFNTSGPRSD